MRGETSAQKNPASVLTPGRTRARRYDHRQLLLRRNHLPQPGLVPRGAVLVNQPLPCRTIQQLFDSLVRILRVLGRRCPADVLDGGAEGGPLVAVGFTMLARLAQLLFRRTDPRHCNSFEKSPEN